MFDHGSDGGLGFQLSMYRLIDDFDEAGRIGRENALLSRADRMRSEYNRLLAHAQALDRALQERNQQLAAVQNDLAMKDQQLVSMQQELKSVTERLTFERTVWRDNMIVQQDRARARARERNAGSQST